MELVSIIVPVYNAGKYITRCVNSLLDQDYKNIQVVIVNDGSTDNTDEIVKKLCIKDNRIKYLMTENGGVAKARNKGLDMADGDYIAFSDADDYVEKNYISAMVEAVKKYDADFCSCEAVHHFYRDGKEVRIRYEETDVDTVLTPAEYDFKEPHFPATVWAKLFKKEVLKDIRFDTDIYVAEDTLLIARALHIIDRFVVIHKNLYHYIEYNESSFHGAYNKKRRTEFIALRRIARLFRDMPDVYVSCRACYADRCLKVIRRYYFHMGVSECFYRKMLKEYRHNIKYIIKHTIKTHTSKDIAMTMAYLFFAVFPSMYPVYYKFRYHVEE